LLGQANSLVILTVILLSVLSYVMSTVSPQFKYVYVT
jgi:hypothetical protein